MARIYVLQHVQPETMGTIAQALEAAGHTASTVLLFAGQSVPRYMDDAGGLVVMGGPMGVYEHDRYPFLLDEMRLIEQALKEEKPVLGICLGSQLLAATLGADVAPAPRKEIGWYPVSLAEQAATDKLLFHVEPSFVGFHWHGDAFTLPRDATAGSRLTTYQAYRYGHNAYGFLFHMEVTEKIVVGMVERFAGELVDTGVSKDQLIEGIEEYLPRLESIAEMVFGRWAALVQ